MNTPNSIICTDMDRFINDHQEKNFKTVLGNDLTYWIQHGPFAMVRFPTTCVTIPEKQELRRIQRASLKPVASYIVNALDSSSANAYLYVRYPPYNKSMLERKPRQSVNRAHKYLTVKLIDWDTLQAHGFPVFRDTRARVGLADGTEEIFRLNVEIFRSIKGHEIFSAWKDDEMMAFFVAVQVDDYCELTLCCSLDGSLKWCPNNALFDMVFNHYLTDRDCRCVSAGLSSVQQGDSWKGLHSFKQHVGFDVVPVQRKFDLHPIMKPIVNSFNYGIMKKLSRKLPGNPLLRKGVGTFDKLLGNLPDE